MLAIGDDVMPVALARGDAVGLALVAGAGQHHHPARRPQEALGRGPPLVVRDVDRVGQHVVRDAGFVQRLAKARDLRRRRRHAVPGQLVHRLLRLALLVVLAREALAQLMLARAQFLELGRQRRAIGLDRGQRLQVVLALGELLHRALAVARRLEGLARFLALLLQVGQLVLGRLLRLEQRQQLRALVADAALVGAREQPLPVQLAQLLRGALALLAPLQHRHDLGGQALALLEPQLVLLVAVDAVGQVGQLRLRVRQLVLRLLDFLDQLLLVVARQLVAVQHFLVAEDLEHQAQQLLGGELAQAVRLALLQRQHAADRARQAGGLQALLPGLDAQPVLVGLGVELLDLMHAVHQDVAAHPVAALARDAAGQRHLVRVQQRARERAAAVLAAARAVVHQRAQPGVLGVGMAGVGLVGPAAGALQPQQRPHRIEQRGLARAVGPGDGDDVAVQRHRDAAAVVPVQQFQGLQVKHQASLRSDSSLWRAARMALSIGPDSASVLRASTSASAPSRMRGASVS